MTLPAVSLFTGAGGLDIGFEQAGYDVRVCLEMDADCCRTIRANRPGWTVIEDDAAKISTRRILKGAGVKRGDPFVLIGGPPCQPFSKSGFWTGKPRGMRDERADCLHYFLRVLEEGRPAAFVMENVHGLDYVRHRDAMHLLERTIRSLGYGFSCKLLNAADYGVPQIRKRIFVIGGRNGATLSFPEPTHAEANGGSLFPDLQPHVNAGEAFRGLPEDLDPVPKELVVGGRWGHLLPLIPDGDNYLYLTAKRGHPDPIFRWRSRYWSFLLKLSRNRPSWTIQASPGPYIGPFHWRNRRLTVEETKRLQTFPDEWVFEGGRQSVQRQLGNAVPPGLARAVAEALTKQLAGR